MRCPEMIDGHLRNKTGKYRAADLQGQILWKGFAMRVLRLKSPKCVQEIGDDKTNDVRQDTRPEWRSADAHERVRKKHEENRDADPDENETTHLGKVGAIRHERTRLSRADASARESKA